MATPDQSKTAAVAAELHSAKDKIAALEQQLRAAQAEERAVAAGGDDEMMELINDKDKEIEELTVTCTCTFIHMRMTRSTTHKREI